MNRSKIVWQGVISAALLGLGSTVFSAETAAADPKAELAASRAVNLAKQLNEAFIEVADKVSPAVVVISVTQKASASDNDDEDNSFWELLPPELRRRFFEERGEGRGQKTPRRPRAMMGRGSGFVISEDGYIITNNHVVEEAQKITVRFKDSKEYVAEVKGRDPQSDLAVIKINAKGLTPVKLGDSAATRVGEFVIAVGAPFDLDYSVTVGHVSAKGRSFERYMGTQQYLDQDFIQTDASINPGNSGGPLINLYGEVIGINSMIRGMNTGIGFAIPSNLARTVSDHLIKDGRFARSWIGVGIGGLREDRDYKDWLPNSEDGVIVHSIVPKGPASKSDLKAGDVVVAVDGHPVKSSRELKEQISSRPVGSTVTLDVFRQESASSGKMKMAKAKVKVKTEALPEDDGDTPVGGKKKSADGETSSNFGLTVRALNKETAEQYGIEMTSGVLVTAVERDSSGEQKGIRAGDIITEVNRVPVSNVKQYREAIKAADAKRGVVVNFVSKGTSRFTVLKESDE